MPSRKDKEKPAPRKRPVEPQAPAAPAGPRLAKVPKGGPSKADLKRYRALLLTAREGLLRSSSKLADEALKASGQDFSVDHMADHGTDNFEQDFSLSLLEGETELVREIDDAIAKIDGHGELPFGLCERCGEEIADRGEEAVETPWIARGRLDAIPYARLCVPHQERQEESGPA